MKNIPVFFAPLLAVLPLFSCAPGQKAECAGESYRDGAYRGNFLDRNAMEVGIQFTLRDNIVTETTYRHLYYGGVDYLRDESVHSVTVRTQMRELAGHLSGKDIRSALDDLYAPGAIIETEMDGLTGATVRSGKVISAIRDALNRGAYSR